MAGEPTSRGDDAPPTAAEVGNHHWPLVTNIFEAHGSKFPLHHSHPGITSGELLRIHVRSPTGGLNPNHDQRQNVMYHRAMEEDGCRQETTNLGLGS